MVQVRAWMLVLLVIAMSVTRPAATIKSTGAVTA